jgi:sortase A
MKTIPPLEDNDSEKNAALELIRGKLDKIYADEPDATEELAEAEAAPHRSKHQAYMHKLNQSGKSLAEIQTAWHEYYTGLTDKEKHQVWQEFYQQHDHAHAKPHPSPATDHEQKAKSTGRQTNKPEPEHRSVAEIKHSITRTAAQSQRRKLSKREHLKSLMFGLSAGMVVVVIFMFGFFNERFIAPFISPSKSVSNSAIIIDPSSTSAGPEPKVIIPKINAELPVIFDQTSIDEAAIQKSLESGVVHYSTTSMPGENGNGAIFGHSSNNILNRGEYKFAFVLLHRMEVGDTFIVQKDSKRYVYKVINKTVVKPTEVGILNETYGKQATFSLITCDPPGTSTNRLVVTGEQITPDPADNKPSTAQPATSAPQELPSNAPSLWSRLTSWFR